MSDAKRDDVIAVINANEDTVEMLRQALERRGFKAVVTGQVHDFKTGETDFPKFLADHDPAVLIYDITIPYERNWTFLRLLLDTGAMRGRKVVVTTTNKRRLEELVGPTDSLEIVGKPYDLEQIVAAVDAALPKN